VSSVISWLTEWFASDNDTDEASEVCSGTVILLANIVFSVTSIISSPSFFTSCLNVHCLRWL